MVEGDIVNIGERASSCYHGVIVTAIRASCSSFLMMPGFFSCAGSRYETTNAVDWISAEGLLEVDPHAGLVIGGSDNFFVLLPLLPVQYTFPV